MEMKDYFSPFSLCDICTVLVMCYYMRNDGREKVQIRHNKCKFSSTCMMFMFLAVIYLEMEFQVKWN